MLNKAGLSKDNFMESDTKQQHQKVEPSPGKGKIEDYFSKSMLELDLSGWDDDESWLEEAEAENKEEEDIHESAMKKPRLE